MPLAVLLPGVVAYAPVTVLVVYLSVRRGRPRLSLAVSVVAMVVTTVAAVALIPPFGTTGAALASSAGYAVGGVLAWILFLRLSRGDLDPELVGEVLNVIRELAASGMTMLIATHEMGFAREIGSRVCFLDGGVILEQGPPEQIFSTPQKPRTQQFLQRIVDAGRL